MKEIYCIAIDDEPLALTIISNFCQRHGGIRLETFCEPRTGLEAIHRLRPDLVFLDIEMNSLSGLEIAHTIVPECLFIFTTAHAQFALEGFNLDAVDFLHKPFAYERFAQALEKAVRRMQSQPEQQAETIVVNQEYNRFVIPIADIDYVEAMENYAKIYCRGKGTVLTKTSLKTIQNMLPENNFVRIHKSFLVAYKNIVQYTHNEVTIQNPKLRKLPIGRTYAAHFREKVVQHSQLK